VERSVDPPDKYLSTGSTLLNLALSDNIYGGFGVGRIVNIIGDSSAGKTFLALTVLAEIVNKNSGGATNPEKLDNDTRVEYVLRYDDAEAAAHFDFSKLFGTNFVEQVEGIDEQDEPHKTVEGMEKEILRLIKDGFAFAYVEDSLDALDTEMEKGGYTGAARAAALSNALRRINKGIKQTSSLLIVVSQTRDNINPLTFTKKRRAGGRSLEFYSSHVLWLAVEKKLKKSDRIIGVQVKVKVSKNKLTGKVREISFPIYYDYGIDDIGSCVDWLVTEKAWKQGKLKIESTGLRLEPMTRSKLINAIEERELETKLREIVGREWKRIEDSLKLNRKGKYHG